MSTPAAPRKLKRGFTLVEVLVTLAVTAILFSLVGSILVAALTTQRKVEATLSRERIGAAILELIGRDVQAMYVYDLVDVFKATDSRGGGGDADGFEFITTRDPAVRDQTDAQAEVAAQSQAAQQRQGAFGGADPTAPVYRDPPQLTKISYTARDSRQNPGLLTVFRSEARFIPPPQATTGTAVPVASASSSFGTQDATEHVMEVYDRVRTFNVRYLHTDLAQNLREWKDTWDLQGEYPAALEIALEIVPDPKADEQQRKMGMVDDRSRKVYRTIIAIPVSQPKPKP